MSKSLLISICSPKNCGLATPLVDRACMGMVICAACFVTNFILIGTWGSFGVIYVGLLEFYTGTNDTGICSTENATTSVSGETVTQDMTYNQWYESTICTDIFPVLFSLPPVCIYFCPSVGLLKRSLVPDLACATAMVKRSVFYTGLEQLNIISGRTVYSIDRRHSLCTYILKNDERIY